MKTELNQEVELDLVELMEDGPEARRPIDLLMENNVLVIDRLSKTELNQLLGHDAFRWS